MTIKLTHVPRIDRMAPKHALIAGRTYVAHLEAKISRARHSIRVLEASILGLESKRDAFVARLEEIAGTRE